MKRRMDVTPQRLMDEHPLWRFRYGFLDVGDAVRRLFVGKRYGEHLLGLDMFTADLMILVSKPQRIVSVLGGVGRLGTLLGWNEFVKQVEELEE